MRIETAISPDAIDVPTLVALVAGPEVGGIGLFLGTVRASSAIAANEGRAVTHLEYEAHPTIAPRRLHSIAEQAGAKWDLGALAAVHRTGRLALGETAVAVACSAPHREAALEACRWVIDTLKAEVPIFKKEIYADGGAWVGVEGRDE